MKYGRSGFTAVPHKDGAFARHLEVGPFHYEFIFSFIPGPFLRADEKLGHSIEVVDVLKIILWILPVYHSCGGESCG